MGMAGHAPNNYHRHRYIGEHAIARLRERSVGRFAHRDDDDLANLLDESIAQACRAGRDDEIVDDGNLRHVVELATTPIETDLIAVCRHDARERREVVMTVLTRDQADFCRSSGKWQKRDPATSAPRPTGLAKLRDVMPAALTTPPLELTPSPGPEPIASEPPEAAPTPTEETETMPKKPTEWLTRDDACKLLGGMNPNYLSTIAVKQKWARKRDGSRVLYPRDKVEAFGAGGAKPRAARIAAAHARKAAPSPAPRTARAKTAELPTPPVVADDDAPTFLIRVAGPEGERKTLECATEGERDTTYFSLLGGGTPATAIRVYRLTAPRLRLEFDV